MRPVDYERTWDRLTIDQHNWSRLSPSGLPCHPTASAHVIASVHADQRPESVLRICEECLQGYLEGVHGVYAPEDVRPIKCERCGKSGPASDFRARNGTEVPFCSSCRSAWGREKREAANLKAEQQERENAEALAHALRAQRELEQSLAE